MIILKSLPFLLLAAAPLFAQSANLAGHWSQDNARSVPVRNGSTVLNITETQNLLTVETTSVREGRAARHAVQRYTLDGRATDSIGADGDHFQTAIKQSGDALVFTVVEHEDGRVIHWNETWRLKDPRTLVRARLSDQPGAKPQVIVYARQ